MRFSPLPGTLAQNPRFLQCTIPVVFFILPSLGGWSGENKDGPLKDWKPTNEIVTVTINFAIATKRLEDRKEQDDSEEENEEGDAIIGEAPMIFPQAIPSFAKCHF